MSHPDDIVTLEQAKAMLPNGDMVHTFRQSLIGMLIGADWKKDSLIEAMSKAPEIMLSGETATAMNHGLAIKDDLGFIFIETRKVEQAVQA